MASSSFKTGPQTLNVIPVNSLTNPVEPYSIAELQAMFTSGTWAQYWAGMSDGKSGPWTINVAPYQTLDDLAKPIDYNSCAGQSDMNAWGMNRLMALYGTVGYFLQWAVIARPNFNCGIVGSGGSNQVFTVGRFSLSTVAHEMGHYLVGTSLGNAAHDNGEHCGPGGCGIEQYGDVYSSLGQGDGTGLGQYSATNLRSVGYLDQPGFRHTQVVTVSGDYDLEPYEHALTSTGVRVLQVPGPGSVIVDLEARVDGMKNRQWPGVILHQGRLLRDLDRVSSNDNYRLQAGWSFTDPSTGHTYEVLSFSETTGARVRITLAGTPVPPPPPSNPRAL